MEIKAINFDFYGTIVDWVPAWTSVTKKIIDDIKAEEKIRQRNQKISHIKDVVMFCYCLLLTIILVYMINNC